MELVSRAEPKIAVPFRHDHAYLALSRMLTRYQNLILLTPANDERLAARIAVWQKRTQAELWSPLPFHRMKWLRNVEGARTVLLRLEQNAKAIKIQRERREVVKDLAEKRMVIKRLRSRVEEISREVESAGSTEYRSIHSAKDDDTETMLDVLNQMRRKNGIANQADGLPTESFDEAPSAERQEEEARDTLFDSSSNIHRRGGKLTDETGDEARGKSSGFSNIGETEKSLLASSSEHENITASLVNIAVQLKQQAKQFQFTLDQDKGLIDRALEGLDQNVSAMGVASKGMKTLQRMSEEQGFWGRLKLQLFIAGLWTAAILLVFIGPKLRF